MSGIHVVAFFVLIAGVPAVAFGAVTGLWPKSMLPFPTPRAPWLILAVLGLLTMVSGGLLENVPWYSPAATAHDAAAVVHQANALRAPATESQVGTVARSAIATVKLVPGNDVSISYAGAGSFTLHVAGDTAQACLTYHRTTTLWSWAPGGCH